MARPHHTKMAERAFLPLCEAAERTDLLDKLRTADLNEDRQSEQFAKLKRLQADGIPPIFLPNGGFLYPFNEGEQRCLALACDDEIETLTDILDDWLVSNGAFLDKLDESTFLFLAYYTFRYYRIRSQYENKAEAQEVLDIVDDDYDGHDIGYLINYYRPVSIIKVAPDSLLSDCNIYALSAELLCKHRRLRSLVIDDDFADSIYELIGLPDVDSEKIFQTLTATRWRHAFLELYRCLESLFTLPRILELRNEIAPNSTLSEIKSAVRRSLNWREQEKNSIEEIFSSLDSDRSLDSIESQVPAFKDLLSREKFKRKSIGRRIYKIRNSLVHHEDYESGSDFQYDDEEYRYLAMYLVSCLPRIIRKFDLNQF